MSDKPTIQIDDDWKRQAQEEKRKLAEEAKAKEARATPAAAGASPTAAPSSASSSSARARETMPAASFTSLVQSIVTQALYYLGELGQEGEPPMLNLDAARHQIDTLDVLEAKTKGNLSKEEQSMLDQGAYELRSRFVSIARQYIQ